MLSLKRKTPPAEQPAAAPPAPDQPQQAAPAAPAAAPPAGSITTSIRSQGATPVAAPTRDEQRAAEVNKQFQEAKGRLHRKLIERLNLANLEKDSPEHREQVRAVLKDLCEQEESLLDYRSIQRLVDEVHNEVFGLGPLEELLRDPAISEIMVNGPKQVYVERGGGLTLTNITFRDNDHLLQIIDRIVSRIGRRCDETSPLVDARLPDGSRVNAVIPPIALDGPSVSIRRFGKKRITIEDYLNFKSIVPEMVEFLAACVKAKLNILVVGGTGSGKTVLLNNLSGFIPASERVITIEDAAELALQQPHIVRLETRPPNIEGRGEITTRDLVKNSLRMRPERIIVGEVRGAEALDMLQAMNTGHEGSMTTLHANSPRDAIARLETLIMMAGIELPIKAMRAQIASAIDLIVQQARLQGGARKVVKITEVQGMEGDMITTQDLFAYEQQGVDGGGRAYGRFICAGLRPKNLERLASHGVALDPEMFQRRALLLDSEMSRA
ncbi:MAG: CpaF family protein [Phycisphaerae bacterium]|nr:CpaF family protein [Phycisphaerae bacterium]